MKEGVQDECADAQDYGAFGGDWGDLDKDYDDAESDYGDYVQPTKKPLMMRLAQCSDWLLLIMMMMLHGFRQACYARGGPPGLPSP